MIDDQVKKQIAGVLYYLQVLHFAESITAKRNREKNNLHCEFPTDDKDTQLRFYIKR